jgi:peptide deformylase
MKKKYHPTELPDYVVINDPLCRHKHVLTTPTERVTFPLDKETWEIIYQLESKFDQADNMAGLAANQIGFNKQIFIFEVPDDDWLDKLGEDYAERMPKSIWINPSFKPLSDEILEDWEGCFSVHDLVGCVPRYRSISYEAWTPQGKKIQGTANGYLARVIQHEVGHLNGQLYIDLVSEDKLITREKYINSPELHDL